MRVCRFIGLATLAMLGACASSSSAAASPLDQGITREEMAGLLSSMGYSAKVGEDTLKNRVVTSAVGGVSFDVYFFDCNAEGRCQAVQFAAGWTMSVAPKSATLNAWNRDKRYMRAYVTKDNKALYGEMDLTVSPGGSTEQIDDYLRLWGLLLPEFQTRFNLAK